MTYTCEIIAAKTLGDQLRVTLGNVRKPNAPEWRGCCPEVQLDVPLSQAHNFTIGRKARIDVELERER